MFSVCSRSCCIERCYVHSNWPPLYNFGDVDRSVLSPVVGCCVYGIGRRCQSNMDYVTFCDLLRILTFWLAHGPILLFIFHTTVQELYTYIVTCNLIMHTLHFYLELFWRRPCVDSTLCLPQQCISVALSLLSYETLICFT